MVFLGLCSCESIMNDWCSSINHIDHDRVTYYPLFSYMFKGRHKHKLQYLLDQYTWVKATLIGQNLIFLGTSKAHIWEVICMQLGVILNTASVRLYDFDKCPRPDSTGSIDFSSCSSPLLNGDYLQAEEILKYMNHPGNFYLVLKNNSPLFW